MSIVFLTYLSRSGSTFLASNLYKYKDIFVSLEAPIPDNVHYGSFKINNSAELESFIENLYTKQKFLAWGVQKDFLYTELACKSFPINFNTILSTILTMRASQETKVHIYKCGHYIFHVGKIRALFPDAKIIFLVRDIRAIYNSQKTAKNSQTGKVMAKNPVETAMYYRQAISIAQSYNHNSWFYLLRYEDMLKDLFLELENLCKFLNITHEKVENKNYSLKIPKEQQHLHSGINASPNLNKIERWRQHLSKYEIYSLQRIAKQEMEKYKYEKVQIENIGLLGYLLYLFWYSKYWVKKTLRYWKNKIIL
ncbi:sulfotransferase [Candidatus Uabimicrobium sp. HlEnr_7]|uniref:sulfotransferase family protein n=1 Tax=Candidatus Uabimicrobium helgolandensis TaxID=3095367 RepID=UPI00355762F6